MAGSRKSSPARKKRSPGTARSRSPASGRGSSGRGGGGGGAAAGRRKVQKIIRSELPDASRSRRRAHDHDDTTTSLLDETDRSVRREVYASKLKAAQAKGLDAPKGPGRMTREQKELVAERNAAAAERKAAAERTTSSTVRTIPTTELFTKGDGDDDDDHDERDSSSSASSDTDSGTERGRSSFTADPSVSPAKAVAMELKALKREAKLDEAAHFVDVEIAKKLDPEVGENQIPNCVEWRWMLDRIGSVGRLPDAFLLWCADLYGFPRHIAMTAMPSSVPGQMIPLAGSSLTTPLGLGALGLPTVAGRPGFEIRSKNTKGDKFRSLFQLHMEHRNITFPTRNRPENSIPGRELLAALIKWADKATQQAGGTPSNSIEIAFALAARNDDEMRSRQINQEGERVAYIASDLVECCLTLHETATQHHVRRDDVEYIFDAYVRPAMHRLPVLLSVIDRIGRTIQPWSIGQLLTGCYLAELVQPFPSWPSRRVWQVSPENRAAVAAAAAKYVDWIQDKSMPRTPLDIILHLAGKMQARPWSSQ